MVVLRGLPGDIWVFSVQEDAVIARWIARHMAGKLFAVGQVHDYRTAGVGPEV
jgi:hypothetical protein